MFVVPESTKSRRAVTGIKTEKDSLFNMYVNNNQIVIISKIESIPVNPILSIVDRGRSATIRVSVSVIPVSMPRTVAKNFDRKITGKVNGTKHPIIIINEERGIITIFERINQTGKRLNSIIVNDNVPACATNEIAVDCHTLSASQFLNRSFEYKIW
jgi:hypothetical protein